jgi:HPt (histidine-containing phosphotransfer) domain-containing protein
MMEDPHAQSPAGDPLALQRLHRWGGEALQRKMIEMFLDRAPAQLAAARAAANADDADGVRCVAHSLKTGAGQLGALSMQRLCEAAERRAEAGEGRSLTPLVRDLEGELERYRAWLHDSMGGGFTTP